MKASALTALLIGASSLALATRAHAQEVVFADNADLAAAALRGERVTQESGVTQIRLSSGAMLSFVEGAEFRLRPDGSVDLFKGNVTVTGAGMSETLVRLGGQGTGKIAGAGSSGSFSVATDASGKTMATGRVLTGLASIANGREERRFNAGQAWEVANGHPRLATSAPVAPAPRMTPQRQAQLAAQTPVPTPAPAPASTPAPEPEVASISEGGPAAAAENGVPLVLGEALAAAGASGDIVSSGQRIEAAVANPSLETFPSNDLAVLVAYAARLESLYGGQPFNQAQADVIRAYLNYLASGQTQAQFLTVYAGLMVQFLDFVRSGAAPSSFSGTSLADINAFISYRSRTDGFAALSSQNRVLVDAYLAFVLGGGNADQFVTRYTSLTSAYFAYLRSGGDPLAFAGATQATLNAYIGFLNDSGLLVRLAETDRALLQAYLANGGTAFIHQYQTALTAYFAYLQSGQLPSQYGAADPAALRQYLETLQATGLFEQVLGAQATFYAQYLAYLKQGGTIDGWQGLPANVFAGYASALSSYQAYLAAGGVPSAYTALDPAVLRQYLDALTAAGALDRFLGAQATFYAQYLAYLTGGGTIDGWQGLPFNVFTGYATALQAYYEFLQNGGLPSAYTALTQDEIRQYLAALSAVDANEAFLGQLASFYSAFFAYLANGGNPDLYTGLPTPPNYEAFADALSAYVAYLQAGGVPSAYTGADLALLQQYIKALIDSGKLATLLGTQAEFLTAYYAFLAGGGTPDGYTALPVYATYVTALEAYYAFLAGGGKPSEYTALTQAQILAYLKALTDAGVLAALFDGATLAFIQSYYVYLADGGNPDQFSGLPGTSAAKVGYNTSAEATLITSPVTADITAEGKINRLQFSQNGRPLDFNYAANPVNVAKEYGRFGDDVAWTRYLSDTSNNAVNFNNHLIVGTPSATIPASGKVDYRLVGGTAPTDYGAAEGEVGTFTGSLAVSFGAAPKIGVAMDVVAGSRSWHVQTAGGAADPTNGGLLIGTDRAFVGTNANLATASTSGGGCVSACGTTLNGNLFGQNAAYAGFAYSLSDRSLPGSTQINGVAVFGQTGTTLAYLGKAPASNVLTGYTGGFNGTSPRINFITTLRLSSSTLLAGSEQGFDALSYTLDSNGGLTSYTRAGNFTRTPGTMTISDVAGDADVLVGRWSDGTNTGATPFTLTADQGFHYMLTRATPTGFAAPTTGTIAYDLLAATKPTWIDGSGAPGTFTGSFKVNFGLALPKIAMEAKIVMPTGGVGGGAYTFDFTTTGGLADITRSTSNFNIFSNQSFSFVVPGDDHSGSCNGNVCYLAAFGNWAGSTDKLALTYTAVSTAGNARNIIGAAAFKIGAGAGTGSGNTTPAAAPDGIVKYVGYLGGGRFSTFENATPVTTDSNGGLTKVDGFFEQSGATSTDGGNASGIVAWSRWVNGNITGLAGTPSTTLGTGGLAQVWGKPATNAPTSGKVDYALVGSTRPATPNAVVGTLDSAKLSVDFSTAKVGFEAGLTVSGQPVTMATSGGTATPSISLRASGTTFGAGTGQMTLTGASGASIEGFLAGVGATHAGVGYYVQTTTGNVAGAIAFGPKAP
jgi:trimeric autotransporter adhesin